MSDRYPGYDVLQKRDTPSWNDPTRRTVELRMSVPRQPRFFTEHEWRTLDAICARIMPQPADRTDPVPLAAMVDTKMLTNRTEGYRYPGMPHQGEAWRRGIAALDEVAHRERNVAFHQLASVEQDEMLRSMHDGKFSAGALGSMPPKEFFRSRVINDIVGAYYAHPTSWSEIGWGGPASPRGYVRLDLGMRDPWEPEEATPGHEAHAERVNRDVR